MAPHSQVCDVDSVEDYVFYAASEIMPISEVLLRSAHQTPNVHLWAGQGIRVPGCEFKLMPLSLSSSPGFPRLLAWLYIRLEIHISPASLFKLKACWASPGLGAGPDSTTDWVHALG